VKFFIMLLPVSLTLCVNSDGRKKRYKIVAHKRSKRKRPEGKLMMYVIVLTILLFLLYFSAKFMILKLEIQWSKILKLMLKMKILM